MIVVPAAALLAPPMRRFVIPPIVLTPPVGPAAATVRVARIITPAPVAVATGLALLG
jgi:hypothetical protein